MSEAIVETKAGGVQGERLKGFRQWLGLRYATAPRFAAPGPVEPWQGVRRADRFGRQCAQAMGRRVPRRFVDSNEFGEDCHFLNVYAPDGGTPGPKPVLVWIHGGAFVGGSANPYDGSRLACEGDIIVVTINYRLGVLGFVNFGDLPGLSAIPSNLGLRDQIAALEWVRDNIAAFGGDPGRVTICGQSAGSISVSLLLLSRQARGLFHGAVMQSGAVSLTHDRERSIADARRYAELLGIERGGLAALRALDIAHLLEVQGKVASELRNAIPAAPWFDDDLLPDTLEAARVHDAAPVPLLAGATHDENRLFELMPGNLLPTRRADLEPIIRDQLGLEQAGRILSAYPAGRKGQTALGSDLAFKVPTRNFAQRQAALAPVWYYQFDYAHPVAGAAHGLDLTLFWPFPGAKMALVRGGRDNGWRKALGERMREHVARFVRRGDPADGWPRYEPQRQAVHIYDLADSLVEAPDAVRFAAWDGRDVTPGKSVRPVPRG